MTNASPFARRTAPTPAVPRGDVLGTYDTYPEAQKVVNRLAIADFPVKQLSIVGNDLKTVERITGKLTYGRAALAGAASGAWFGLFLGLLLFLFSPTGDFSFILAAALIGAGFGLLFGVVSYALNRRRRDFTATHQVVASNYQVIIDPNLTARARLVLAGDASAAAEPVAADAPLAPPAPESATSRPAAAPASGPGERPAGSAGTHSGTTPDDGPDGGSSAAPVADEPDPR